MVLAAATVVGAQFVSTPAASAQDVWAASSSKGYEYYVISESVHGQWGHFYCEVKTVYNGRLQYTTRDEFAYDSWGWYYVIDHKRTYISPGSIMYSIMETARHYT